MDAHDLRERLPLAAFAFRGYNVTNLGRTAELMAVAAYRPILEKWLREAEELCLETIGKKIDLSRRILANQETTLDTYVDAIAMIVAVEQAQIELLDQLHGIQIQTAKVCMGYSLGEISALVACGVVSMPEALRIPVSLAADCVALAEGVHLGILISRGAPLSLDNVRRLCIRINAEGRGVVGISAYLSPNSLLMIGQNNTLKRVRQIIKEEFSESTTLRRNRGIWPPLHTPIVWDRNIPNRSAVLMHTMRGGLTEPDPPVLSLVTGQVSYNDYNAREILHRWADHPQRLWDAVYETLSLGLETIVHVGPAPNIIPATYARLHDNVEAQTRGSIGMRALSAVVHRPWLQTLLPQRSALLRVLRVEQIVLEDWLLENAGSL